MSKDVYAMITDSIIQQLEKGVIPWEQPWKSVRSGAFNRISKKSYSLLNQMLLQKDGEWGTFKQWSELGGKIRKGEKSSFIVFWKLLEKETTTTDGEVEKATIPYLKYINVFHISQVDGVEPLNDEQLNDIDADLSAEQVASDYLSRFNINFDDSPSNQAFYSPAKDLVSVPNIHQFSNKEEYYSTLFHELTHSTGHKSRLNRLDPMAHYGKNESYSKEELVAEIGACMCLSMLNMDSSATFNNSASYIDSWLQVLKNDKKFIVSASSQSEKAVNLIFNIQ